MALTQGILGQVGADWRLDWLSALVGALALVFLWLVGLLLWRSAGRVWAAIRAIGARLLTPFTSRYERRYLGRVARSWRQWRVGLDAPPLDEAFVTLRLAPPRTLARDLLFEAWGSDDGEILRRYEARVGYAMQPEMELEEALTVCQHLVLLGGLGAGKTSALLHLGLAFAQGAADRVGLEESRLPIYISLPELLSDVSIGAGTPTNRAWLRALANWLAWRYEARPGELARLAFRRAVRQGRCVFLLDDAGQVALADRPRLAAWLQWLATSYPANRVVVASDPALGLSVADEPWVRLEIMPLEPLSAQTLAEIRLRRTRGADDEVDVGLHSMWRSLVALPRGVAWAGNPFAVSLAAALHGREEILPDSWTGLLGKTLELSLQCVADKLPDVNAEECWDLLADLALDLLLERRQRFRRAGLLHRARACFRRKRAARACVEALVAHGGLLQPSGREELQFSHRALAGYLAAWRIAVDGQLSVALEHLDDPAWRPTILSVCGLASADQIVEALAQADDDLFHSRLLFAAECLAQDGATDAQWVDWASRSLAEVLLRPYQCQWLRRRATRGLTRMGGVGPAHVLAQGMRSEEVHLRRICAWGAGLSGGQKTVQVLSRLIVDADWAVRMIAAHALRWYDTRETLDLLAGALSDEVEAVREAAAESLALSGLDGLNLIERSLHQRDPIVRRAAVRGVAAVGPAYALPLLQQVRSEEREWYVNSAIEAAEQRWSGDAAVLEHLLARGPLHEEPWLVRWAANRGQTMSNRDVAFQMLRRALNANEWLVRASAAEALGQRGDESAIEWLRPLLEDPVLEVRDATYEALWAIARRSGAAISH